jgi:hypothetical protein
MHNPRAASDTCVMGAADSRVLLGGLLLTRRGVIDVLAVGRTARGAHFLDRELRVPLAAGKARLLQITRMITVRPSRSHQCRQLNVLLTTR